METSFSGGTPNAASHKSPAGSRTIAFPSSEGLKVAAGQDTSFARVGPGFAMGCVEIILIHLVLHLRPHTDVIRRLRLTPDKPCAPSLPSYVGPAALLAARRGDQFPLCVRVEQRRSAHIEVEATPLTRLSVPPSFCSLVDCLPAPGALPINLPTLEIWSRTFTFFKLALDHVQVKVPFQMI